MDKKLHIVSLGCTKNLVDSEVMLKKLNHYKITDDSSEADVIIVNTCGFIDSAKEESLNTVLNLHKGRKKESKLVMAGCLSERYKEELQEELSEVDIFTGVGDYDKIDSLIELKESRFSPEAYLIGDEGRTITGSNTHAYIKLSEGCNQQCSFCAIPSFKGRLKSRSIEQVAREVEQLVSRKFYDFSFISQDSSSYLRDVGEKNGLIKLIKSIENIKGVRSARILYLYPSTTTLELIEVIGESKIFHNYFDMPIQHINDGMLQLMRRGFGKSETLTLLNAMRKLPNSFLRTSFIVGHPSESEEIFSELFEFVREFRFDRANIFSYSDEEGTKAYGMSNKIDKKIVDSRAEKLGELVREITYEKLDGQIGEEVDAVVYGVSDEHEYLLSARMLNWAVDVDGEILINDTNDLPIEFEKIYRVKITQRAENKLIGSVLA